jgi:acyl-ACP thioesterase
VVRLGDVLPSGETRLDALARYLQDVASDDAVDAAVDGHLAWVVRRTALVVYRRPRYQERLDLVTWASGTGGRWAERRTTIRIGGEVVVDAAALWVSVNPATLRPARLGPQFWAVYGEAAGTRTVSSRLRHPDPPAGVPPGHRPWPLRLADLDVLQHVNNAAPWMAVEEEVSTLAPAGRVEWAELEYRAPIERSARVMISSRIEPAVVRVWLLDDAAVLASAVVGVAPLGRRQR